MNINEIASLKLLKDNRYWLLGIAGGLEAIHLTLTWGIEDFGHLGMSVLFLMALGSLISDKRNNLIFESNLSSSLTGVLLIGLVLWGSIAFPEERNFIYVVPIISALSVSFLASGFKGLKQYWQELTILFFLGVPIVISSLLFDISPLTAKFSAFLLHYLGFNVSLNGMNINLPTGGVEVYYGCSGIETMTYLLGLSVIALFMFPISRQKQPFVPIVGVTLGFIINAIRVAIMAILVASGEKEAFHYWHEGNGSRMFVVLAVLIFGSFYWLLLQQEEKAQINNSSQS
ncbi:MAG: cyanoexosortase A [Rivularia sp. (in: Bacteria)]|nr:cyanoexosortase A [Rivularia sp. MS3]